MISQGLADAINRQIVNELFSSNAYLQIASYFDGRGLKVLARHFFRQSDEERGHALRLLRYLLDVGKPLDLGSVPQPPREFKSTEHAIQTAVDQELEVTRQINALMATAHKESDYASIGTLQWFVEEQVEEVSSMSDLLQLVSMAGEERLLLVEDRLMRSSEADSEDAKA